MVVRWILLLLLLALGAFLLLLGTGDDTPRDGPEQILPWQIRGNADGTTTVFGITPGHTRLAEVLETLGRDSELAVLAAPGGAGSLEMYYGRYQAGPLTGKLVLRAAVAPEQLQQWQQRAARQEPMPSGQVRKFTLNTDDASAALQSVVQSIAFLPAVNLDEEIVTGRFGEPAQRVQTAEGVVHYLYPGLGLDVTVSAEEKDVLQYVAPGDFEELLLAPLR